VKKAAGMRSGELAAAAGVSADTLRHYEKAGLLPAPRRLANGYRVYPAEALDLVLLVQRGLAIGFGLDEIGVFLRARRAGSPPCRKVHALATKRLAELEQQIESLIQFREYFRQVLEEWDERLAGTPDGSPARLLETLTLHTSTTEARALGGWRFVHNRRKKGEP
jgi:DNA-binding transcriptional MerR regulator